MYVEEAIAIVETCNYVCTYFKVESVMHVHRLSRMVGILFLKFLFRTQISQRNSQNSYSDTKQVKSFYIFVNDIRKGFFFDGIFFL